MGLGLEEMLLGADPLQPESIWQKLYSGSKMTGRRGALILRNGGHRHGAVGYQRASARGADLQIAWRCSSIPTASRMRLCSRKAIT